ncbi:DMT family transporter [Roseiconus nitratireducens]|uniref:DMT family transporter n=1 Tax=Roseiconus nitratireducens TaxID=2605748 RepID=A0A5M6DI43_9BACT|nr:DMT family transporter [Roseiconus nitratireducens]KAA5547228.1 DMT family transporter [Roseiconus nitratireducens]
MPDFLKLHIVVLLWGLTAVLGNLIHLSATQVALYRSGLSALILFVVLRRQAALPMPLMAGLLGNGMLLGFHWVLFFLAVKVANVSICMVGMATVSFWTALLEPVLVPRCVFQRINLVLGLVVMAAVYVIFRSETQFHSGLLVALGSALLASLFSIINGRFSGRIAERTIVMYEMAGAGLFCSLAIIGSDLAGSPLTSPRWLPTAAEWVSIAILVIACTIYTYLVYVELLRRLSVFTINFANNLEPVYGITLGAIFFGDQQHVGWGFTVGTAIILLAVIAQPYLTNEHSIKPAAENDAASAEHSDPGML